MRVETTEYSLGAEPPGPAFERRDGERHLTLFRVGTLVIDDQRELCLIKNISAGGMMLRAYRDLAVGQSISVELKHGQPLGGQISWIRDQQVGFTFDEPIDVLAVLAPVTDGPKPRMPRIETETYATVRDGARTFHMRTCDISQGGVKVASTISLPVGTEVVVTLPGLSPQPGSVRWAERGYIGITFNRLLALPALVEWLRSQRDASYAA
nr:PilZ domain-containing protein [Sphingomonas arenae]